MNRNMNRSDESGECMAGPSNKPRVDLREKVEDDRGLIKKIELAIPGFRGYRKREDLRIADSLLRAHLAGRLQAAVTTVEQCRNELATKMRLDVLENMGKLINKISSMENRVRHAEQGYTGISADHRVDVDELNKLYEWDLKLIDHINDLNKLATSFKKAIDDESKTTKYMDELEGKILEFDQVFGQRIQKIAGLI